MRFSLEKHIKVASRLRRHSVAESRIKLRSVVEGNARKHDNDEFHAMLDLRVNMIKKSVYTVEQHTREVKRQ